MNPEKNAQQLLQPFFISFLLFLTSVLFAQTDTLMIDFGGSNNFSPAPWNNFLNKDRASPLVLSRAEGITGIQ